MISKLKKKKMSENYFYNYKISMYSYQASKSVIDKNLFYIKKVSVPFIHCLKSFLHVCGLESISSEYLKYIHAKRK